LKKHEYANAGWEDLVGEFESASDGRLKGDDLTRAWIKEPGMFKIKMLPGLSLEHPKEKFFTVWKEHTLNQRAERFLKFQALFQNPDGTRQIKDVELQPGKGSFVSDIPLSQMPAFVFSNYGDYGYGIFLLDDKSRDYVLKHIGEEKDPFLRSMMWGALWDSVREAELDPREYVELVIRQLGGPLQKPARSKGTRSDDSTPETDETIIQSLLGRVSTALNYYMPTDAERVSSPSVSEGVQPQPRTPSLTASTPRGDAPAGAPGVGLRTRLETVLLERMQHAETPGQRITFYRAFVSNASTEKGREVLKAMLAAASVSSPSVSAGVGRQTGTPTLTVGLLTLRTKDKFDIVSRRIILGDPDAPKLLAELEKTETSDDAKRYAYAAHAAFATAENRAKFWNDFVNNKDISESWIESAIGPFNSILYPELSQPYLERALKELPNLKRTRKIFFINNWLGAWLGGQRDEKALAIVNKFLTDNPQLDNDLRLKVLENVDVIERAVKIRAKYGKTN
jgi:aminopeptidase N